MCDFSWVSGGRGVTSFTSRQSRPHAHCLELGESRAEVAGSRSPRPSETRRHLTVGGRPHAPAFPGGGGCLGQHAASPLRVGVKVAGCLSTEGRSRPFRRVEEGKSRLGTLFQANMDSPCVATASFFSNVPLSLDLEDGECGVGESTVCTLQTWVLRMPQQPLPRCLPGAPSTEPAVKSGFLDWNPRTLKEGHRPSYPSRPETLSEVQRLSRSPQVATWLSLSLWVSLTECCCRQTHPWPGMRGALLRPPKATFLRFLLHNRNRLELR